MPYKNKSERKKYYESHKEEINRKRREYESSPIIKRRKSIQFKRWRENNLERARQITNGAKKRYEERAKISVLEHYGKVCACCGESNPIFLSIDHMNGGGTKHRKKIKEKITTWLVKNNFPSGYQTLCFNCNWGKHLNHGICPHKEISNL